MTLLDFLQKFRMLLLKESSPVSDIEMTSGNYDNFGNLIKTDIPTITTDLCEIGIFDDTLYFVVIVFSNTFNKTAFDSLKIFPNIKIYGFKEFNKTLYPASNFVYENFEKEILNDRYLQIQFSYKYNAINPQNLLKEYKKIKELLINLKLQIVNQLNDRITSLEK